ATRLGSGLVFKLRLLSDEEKAEALHAYASGRGFALSPELTDYLLQHGRRDLPALMAVLDALDHYSLQTKRPVTLPLLHEVLQLRCGSSAQVPFAYTAGSIPSAAACDRPLHHRRARLDPAVASPTPHSCASHCSTWITRCWPVTATSSGRSS